MVPEKGTPPRFPEISGIPSWIYSHERPARRRGIPLIDEQALRGDRGTAL